VGRRPWTRALATAFLPALVCAVLAACSDATVGVRTQDGSADGSAPPAVAGNRPEDRPAIDRILADASPTPSDAATSGVSTPPDDVPAGGHGETPGTGAPASQPTGRGWVDAQAENALPGTPGWQTVRAGRHGVEGFADATSVEAGQPVRLFVSTAAPTFRVQVLRLGWYGGLGARQVWMSERVRGVLQPGPQQDAVTRMITAPWAPSAVLPTDGLVAGDYLAKLLAQDGTSSIVPFAVREPVSSGAVLLLNSTLTWLAYNPWGGANSYTSSDASSHDEGYDERSVVSSLDRPYARGGGSGGLLDEEFNLIRIAERLGLRLNYASDLDLHSHPEVLAGATGVVLLGHSEYWSRPMRAALSAARDAGVNLAFLGANDLYRRIRLQPSTTGPFRQMINYKDGNQDPVKTEDTTADWPHAPYQQPESSLVGPQYRCAHVTADLVITDPDSWLFRGLGVRAGQKLPGMVGTEFDRVSLALPTPRPIQIMAHSPVSCYGYPEFSDLTWYSTPSGAGVFAAGTLNWNAGVGSPDPTTRGVVTQVTEQVLRAMARPRAGASTPAVDNAGRYYNAAGVPLDPQGRPIAPPVVAPSGAVVQVPPPAGGPGPAGGPVSAGGPAAG
jgi:hypothetical protein